MNKKFVYQVGNNKKVLPHSRADCLEIWEPQPPGTLRACPGPVMGLLYLYFNKMKSIQKTFVNIQHFMLVNTRRRRGGGHGVLRVVTMRISLSRLSLTIPRVLYPQTVAIQGYSK